MEQVGWGVRDQVLAASELSGLVLRLPATPVQGWSQLASEALSLLAGECPLVAGLCEHSEDGEESAIEDAGVLGSTIRTDRELAEFEEGSYEHWRLGENEQVGSETLSVSVRDLEPATRHLWAQRGAEELLFSSSAMNDDLPRRRLVVVFGLTSRGLETREARLRVLEAVSAPLLLRARVAFGTGEALKRRDRITEREEMVLKRLLLGQSVREIAEALNRSPHTVHDHAKSLHAKLRANSRGELVARALGHRPEGCSEEAPCMS